MNLTEYFEFGLLVIVLIAIIVGVVKLVHKHMKNIDSPEDFIEYVMKFLQDKIIPYIMKKALELDDLDGSMNYAEFLDKFKAKFVDELLKVLTDDKLNDLLQIPDNLKAFVTKQNIQTIVNRAFELKEVDDFVHDIYLKLIDRRLNEIKKIDDETVAYNAEVGVEDDETLQKEDLGIAKHDDASGVVDIGAELLQKINQNDLFVEEDIDE